MSGRPEGAARSFTRPEDRTRSGWHARVYPDAGEATMWLRRTPAPEDALHAGTPAWADLNEEERAEDNRRRAAAWAKKGARLYAVANALRFMWVLTWPDEVLLHGPEDYREAMRLVGQLVRCIRDWNGGEPLPYLYGAKVHPGRGGWHVNLLVGVRVPHEVVWRLWRHVLGVDEGRGFVYVTDFFRHGQSVRASYRAAAGYAAKYVGKDFEDFGESRPAGAHRYEVAEGFRPAELRRWSAERDVTWGMVVAAMDGEVPSEMWDSPGPEAGWRGPPVRWAAWAA